MVIVKLRKKIRRILEESGTESAAFETEQLLKHCLGENYFLKDSGDETEEAAAEKIISLAVRRAKGEPLQYLIGEWDFFGYTFKVGEGVLIPRPETELLVEKVLPLINENSLVIDLCSGSGCIPIAISRKSGARCWGIELSKEAASFFAENNKLNNTENKVFIIKDDVLNPKKETFENLPKADLITANPPYLTAEEMNNLQREVRHEPESALYGGIDGLDFYRVIFKLWKEKLNQGAFFAAETGDDQAPAVKELMEREGFHCQTFRDLNGTERTVIGKLSDTKRQENIKI